MKLFKYIVCLFLLAAGAFVISCSKENDFWKYAGGGEIRYPAKADTVIVQPGYKRIRLRVALKSDPAVTKVKVYWNTRTDSIMTDVVRSGNRDTVSLLIDGLTEGLYNFEIFTYDKNNNMSVVSNASGNVYGDNYVGSLSNRIIKSLDISPAGEIVINWEAALPGETGIEVKYLDYAGAEKTLIVPVSELVTKLPSFTDQSILRYRSLFKPDINAYDEFSVDYSSVTLPAFERPLAKDRFAELILPTDVHEGGYGWLMPYLWNDNYDTPGFATQNSADQWFTFDMGEQVLLSRFKLWQASDRLYNLENTKKFEIWGSTDPNPDGSWDSWTKLMTCESIKPSGLPVGQNSAEDIAYAKAGEEFIFPQGIPEARYIRIKVLETWGNRQFITIGELTFYTHDR